MYPFIPDFKNIIFISSKLVEKDSGKARRLRVAKFGLLFQHSIDLLITLVLIKLILTQI